MSHPVSTRRVDAARSIASASAGAMPSYVSLDPAHRNPPAEPRTPRHLAVVEAPRPRLAAGRLRARLLLSAAAVVAVAVAFSLVYLHVVMAQRQFRLDSLSAQVAKQQATYDRLRLAVAQLDSPQQIIATAEGKLGMHQPTNVVYLAPTVPLPAGPPGSPSGADGPSAPVVSPWAGQSSPTAGLAPAGDADWPQIKAELAAKP